MRRPCPLPAGTAALACAATPAFAEVCDKIAGEDFWRGGASLPRFLPGELTGPWPLVILLVAAVGLLRGRRGPILLAGTAQGLWAFLICATPFLTDEAAIVRMAYREGCGAVFTAAALTHLLLLPAAIALAWIVVPRRSSGAIPP